MNPRDDFFGIRGSYTSKEDIFPFYMLRLQDIIYKEPTEENFHQLQNLIQHDILDSIQINVEHGNISQDDGNQLAALTSQLYDQIYAHYDAALGGEELMRRILPGALELPSDRLEMEVERLEIEIAKQKREAEERRREAEERRREAEERRREAEEQKRKVQERDRQIAELQAKLAIQQS